MKRANFWKNIYFFFFIGILILVSIFFISKNHIVSAQELWQTEAQTDAFAQNLGLEKQSLPVLIANYVKIFLSFLGILVIIIILYAGYLWMTAGGDTDKVDRAKKWLRNGLIGLLLIVSAYAIASFVVRSLTGAVENTSSSSGYGGSGGSYGDSWSNYNGGALGRLIRNHYPARDANNVPRNTSIFITFTREIDINSIKLDNGKINIEAIKIFRTVENDNDPLAGSDGALSDVDVEISDDFKTIRLKPNQYLGDSNDDVKYTVFLTDKILLTSGDRLFANGNFYFWNFTVGTYIDNTPPKVLSVIPIDPPGSCVGGCFARNKVVQVIFSEAVNPLTVSGLTSNNFTNLTIGENVDGEWLSTNNYRMAVFMPSAGCEGGDVNSCGQKVFCLPASTTFNAVIHSATLMNTGDFQAQYPFDGVVDMADNALDGNNNGQAEGRGADDYTWTFSTNNDVKLTPPQILSLEPSINAENVDSMQDVRIKFSDTLLSSSLKDAFHLFEAHYDANGKVVKGSYWNGPQILYLDENDPSVLIWKHYSPLDIAKDGDNKNFYMGEVLSTLQDDYQNCYIPASGPGCSTTNWQTGPWDEGEEYGPFPNCDRSQD